MALDRLLSDTAAAVSAALGEVEIDGPLALGRLSTEQFLTLLRQAGELMRIADAVGVLASGELTRRVQTDAEFRRAALGGDVGGRFASDLARETTRVDDDTLRAWDRAGDAIAPRVSLQGEVLPCRHEAVAAAILAGTITARAAATIAVGIERVEDLADADAVAAIEATLVEYSSSVTTRELNRLVRTLPDRFDPDGAEPREDLLRAQSRVTIRQLPNGLTRMVAELHPEAAGFLLTALDARTAPRRTVAFAEHLEARDDVVDDNRPLAEKRVDALTSIMRQAVRIDAGTLAGTAVTMLVTVPLETLTTGVGAVRIGGVDEPISASTARRQPWSAGGRTDLDNGALLCACHHRRFDHDGWGFVRERGIPYLIPPPWLDPARTPRRAGRITLAA